MSDRQPLKDERILIAGLDPRIGGGVPAMMSATARNLRQLGASVAFIHLAQPNYGPRRRERLEWEGSSSYALSYRRTPNTFLNYFVPARRALDLVRDFDTLFLVGVSQAGILFWPDDRPYRAWLATTVVDEYLARSWKRELADHHWGWALNRATLPVTKGFESSVIRRTTDLFALSRSTQRSLLEDYGAGSAYLPFPIDTNRFTPGAAGDAPAVIYVGRVDDNRKNVPLLVRAFAGVLERVPRAELWLVGSYAPDGRVARLTRELRLADSVKFLGVKTDDAVTDLYRRATLFALPSRQEGLGIVVLEAMACGLPVVSTMCGGPEEDLRQSHAGELVPQDDAAALAAAICGVLEDKARRLELRENAIEYVRAAHSDSVFREALEGDPNSAGVAESRRG